MRYDSNYIRTLYDILVADITEGKNVSSFFDFIKINMTTFIEERFEFLAMFFRDIYFGDDNNEIIIFKTTPIFRQMISNMKMKIDDDINGNPSLEDINDFSRPKMVMIGAHDDT